MNRLALLPLLYFLLTAATCPGPEPWDCTEQQEALAAQPRAQMAPFYRVADDRPGRYIVTLKVPAAAPAGVSAVEAAESRIASLAQSYGATNLASYPRVGQFAADLTRAQRQRLRRDPAVLFVEQDGRKRVSPIAAVEAASWGLDRIDQRGLPLDGLFDPGGDGAGVHAYVIDTGVDRDHSEFAGRLGEGFNSVGDRIDDDNGHGTHVAGTIAGATYGVAGAAVIHPVRVLRNGEGSDSQVIQGIDWATAHALDGGWPAVANMSLGGDTSRSLDTAVCRSLAAGLTHVVAAGNDQFNACRQSPAQVRQAITMGATERDDDRAWFSNYGECVDLFAPGVEIKSAWRGGGSNTISGTSMASPHGAGVAALVLAGRPAAPPAEVKRLLEESATPDVVGNPRDSPNRLLYARQD